MKYKKNKVMTFVLAFVFSLLMCNITYAHQGRTDSNGGHRDNNNVSGLGSYHYHCGGHPAHLHTNGICPYSSNASQTNSNSSTSNTNTYSNSSSSSHSRNESTKKVSNTVEVESIKIQENDDVLKVGGSIKLNASVLPDNATDKSVTWKSSDEDVVKVNSNWEVSAIKAGQAYVTASTSNKKDTILIRVEDDEKEESKDSTTNVTKANAKGTSNDTSKSQKGLGGVLALGVLGGTGYFGYKKYKSMK